MEEFGTEKRFAVSLLALMVLFGVCGYGVAQLLVQRTMTASVRIRAEGAIAFYDEAGAELTALDFGELSVLEKSNATLYVRNIGNVPLEVTFTRTDANNVLISIRYLNPDGTQWNPSTPRSLEPGAETPVVFEVWGKTGAVGEYALEFTFIGEG